MTKSEQKFIDRVYENRDHWSNVFLTTLLDVLEDEIDRRINKFYKALGLEEDEDGVQDV